MKWLHIFALLVLSTISSISFANASYLGGKPLSVLDVRKIVTTAYVTDDKEWCTPAVQIGPRTFITAAHCIPLIQNESKLRIIGEGINALSGFLFESLGPILSDENTFSATDCKALFEQLHDGDSLTREQMKICWANNGQADVALLITDQSFGGKMISVASAPIQIGETFNLLGYGPSCGGDLGFYRSTPFKVFGFINSQVVFDGTGTGISDKDSTACSGDSGGIYFRGLPETPVEITAVHSGGTKEQSLRISIYGKTVFLPAHFAGGTDITTPIVRQWLARIAQTYGLEICGVNTQCPRTLH
ncbi:MAG: hypothetical protein ACXVB4_19310 [Pseudobdellovibrionaceae bacterium]